MDDTQLNAALADLGVDGRTSRTLAALPLVEVGWSDGKIKDAERDAIIRIADETLRLDEDGAVLLTDWLRYAPSKAYHERAMAALIALAARDRHGVNRALLESLPDLAQKVAESHGGLFGFFRVTMIERATIDAIRKRCAAMSSAVDQAKTEVSESIKRVTVLLGDDDDDADDDNLVGVLIVGTGDARTKIRCTESGVTLGRADDATIRLLDPNVAPEHARVVTRRRRFYVEDQNSPSGTFVNGERVGVRRVLGGETIRVGSTELTFKMAQRSASAV